MKRVILGVVIMFIFAGLFGSGFEVEWADSVLFSGALGVYVSGSNVYGYGGCAGDWLCKKYDADGALLWSILVDYGDGITYSSYVCGLCVVDSAVYIVGSRSGLVDDDAFIIEKHFEGDSEAVWMDSIGGRLGVGVDADEDGNIYAVATGWYVMRYDSLGSVIWAESLANCWAYDVKVCGGYLYVVGRWSGGSSYDYMVVKYDTSGMIVWADTVDGGDDDCAHGVDCDADGNVYVCGEVSGNWVIVEYDNLGNMIWCDTVEIPGSFDNEGVDVAVNVLEEVYSVGILRESSDVYNVLVRYVSGGLVAVDTLSFEVQGVDVDYLGNVYVAGFYEDDNYDCSCWYVGKYYPIPGVELGASVYDVGMNMDVSSVSNGNVCYSCDIGDGYWRLLLYSVDGRLLRVVDDGYGGVVEGNIAGLSAGVYFLVLEHERGRMTKKAVLMK